MPLPLRYWLQMVLRERGTYRRAAQWRGDVGASVLLRERVTYVMLRDDDTRVDSAMTCQARALYAELR